jgi:hypothetical protein
MINPFQDPMINAFQDPSPGCPARRELAHALQRRAVRPARDDP